MKLGNEKQDKFKVLSIVILVTAFVVVLGLSVWATMWLYKQNIDVWKFFVRMPVVHPIYLFNVVN